MSAENGAILWLVILCVGVGTYLLRLSFLQLLSGVVIPPLAQRFLRLVPASVLSALVVPSLVSSGQAGLAGSARLIAGVLAALVAWRTRSVMITLVAGMAILWTLRALAG